MVQMGLSYALGRITITSTSVKERRSKRERQRGQNSGMTVVHWTLDTGVLGVWNSDTPAYRTQGAPNSLGSVSVTLCNLTLPVILLLPGSGSVTCPSVQL